MYLPSRLGRLITLVIAALTLTSLVGCASLKIYSYTERGTALAQYRTYNWDATDSLATGDPRLDSNPFFHDRIRADVEKQLTGRGFEKVVSGAPEVTVHYHASVTQKIDLYAVDQRYGSCEDCKPSVYEAGTILVDLVDTRTNRLLWRGWAEGAIDGVVDNQKWMEEKVDEAVLKILEKLPRRL